MATIDILMASYNGEKFINAQLCSLVSQSFKDWRLLIHDDGSTDNTINIIKSWAEKDNRIVLIEDNIKCGGAAKNFLYLTQFSNAPYCMFCDQDDIWFDNKIETFYKAISNEPAELPIAAYSRSYLWDPDKGILGITGWKFFPNNLKQFICQNAGIQGCSAICNKTTIQYLRRYKGRVAMHDHLLNLFVLVFGYAIPISTPLMLYRQHSANVTGGSPDALPILKRIIWNLHSANPVIDDKHYNCILDFYEEYKNKIDANKCKDIEEYLAMPNYTLLHKIYTIILRGWSRNGSKIYLILKLLIHPYKNEK